MLEEARPAQTGTALSKEVRGIFADIYKECCKNEAECKIIDVMIAQLIAELNAGEQMTERAVAKITGLSKSGVRKVEAQAQQKVKKMLAKQGITKLDDIIDAGGGRSDAKGGNKQED